MIPIRAMFQINVRCHSGAQECENKKEIHEKFVPLFDCNTSRFSKKLYIPLCDCDMNATLIDPLL